MLTRRLSKTLKGVASAVLLIAGVGRFDDATAAAMPVQGFCPCAGSVST